MPILTPNDIPRIGISCNRRDGQSCIAQEYIQSVLLAGGAPVLVPVITDEEMLDQIVQDLDGLIMTGGGDINPLLVDEEPIQALGGVDTFRDSSDLLLLRLAKNRQLPLFGICRGHQLINVSFGGTIYQDIYSQCSTTLLKHNQQMDRKEVSHTVRLSASPSRLKTLCGERTSFPVNSIHHQAVARIAPEFVETAAATDGINEAIEHAEYPIMGVQWHPETLACNGDKLMTDLFRLHTNQAKLFRQAKHLHRRILTIDSHTDTPMFFEDKMDLGVKAGNKVNLPLMQEGMIDSAFMVAYIPQGKRDDDSLRAATAFAIDRLEELKRQETLYPEWAGIAYTPDDLIRLKREHKKAIFLGVENGYALGKDLANVDRFKEMGVSYITLCHNGANDVCDSAKGDAEWGGLSPFGKDVVRRMNELGMMVDVSHAADSTFYDALELSSVPIIASHSSCRALCNHPRNLTDDQIRALAAKDGVVQICLYEGFINEDEKNASLSDAIRHILHVVDLVGVDYVGIGSDFDGGGELIGCRAANELINITTRLLAHGFNEEEIAKIWGGNLLRVMRNVMKK